MGLKSSFTSLKIWISSNFGHITDSLHIIQWLLEGDKALRMALAKRIGMYCSSKSCVSFLCFFRVDMKSSQFKDLDKFEIRPLVIQHTNGVSEEQMVYFISIYFFLYIMVF